jgi:hypothetical protein
VVCSEDGIDFPLPEDALSQSLLLADAHSVDSEGDVHSPCSSATWEAWHTGDPVRMNQGPSADPHRV